MTTPLADLSVLESVSNATPNVGDAIIFTVTLSNQGPAAATNVQVSDLLPAGLTFLSATRSQGTLQPAAAGCGRSARSAPASRRH